jgi:hypothetical protein
MAMICAGETVLTQLFGGKVARAALEAALQHVEETCRAELQ